MFVLKELEGNIDLCKGSKPLFPKVIVDSEHDIMRELHLTRVRKVWKKHRVNQITSSLINHTEDSGLYCEGKAE